MLVDDELGNLRRHLFGSIAPPTHLLVVETLGHRMVFFPPSAQRVHIVRAGRADRLIRSVGRMRELNGRIFRHTLDLETEDLQLVHHIGYASRYHSEVFAAAEHMRCTDERRQFAHSGVAPEGCMTTIEIVVVDTHEHLFLIAVKLVERMALIDRDTRMQPTRTTLVFHEEHFAMEIDQTVAYIMYRFLGQAAGFELFLIAKQTISPFLHFRLRVKLRTEPIDVVIACLEGVFLSPFGIKTKDVTQEVRTDIRLGHTIPVKANTLCAEIVGNAGTKCPQRPHTSLLRICQIRKKPRI